METHRVNNVESAIPSYFRYLINGEIISIEKTDDVFTHSQAKYKACQIARRNTNEKK